MLGSVDANTGDAQTGESLALLKLQNASSSFTLSFLHVYMLLVRRKRDYYDVATGMSYGFHLGVGISPYVIQKQAS